MDSAPALNEAEASADAIWRQMIALQEELDWIVSRLYGLTDEMRESPQPPFEKGGNPPPTPL